MLILENEFKNLIPADADVGFLDIPLNSEFEMFTSKFLFSPCKITKLPLPKFTLRTLEPDSEKFES